MSTATATTSVEQPGAITVAGVRVLGPLVTQSVGPDGGQVLLSNTSFTLTVPAEALGGRGVNVQMAQVATDSLPTLPDSSFKPGMLSLQVSVLDTETGAPLTTLRAPLTLTYQINSEELSSVDNQASRVHWADWLSGTWQALPCTVGGDTHTLSCSLAYPGLVADLVGPTPGTTLDWDVPGGHFYLQTNGFGGAGRMGYTVVDDASAAFWTEFQRLGGVQQLGYPISGRFQYKGFTTQAFQRLTLQWRQELKQAVPLNVFDDLNQRGADAWLNSMREVPPAADTGADIGLAFEDILDRHLALLDEYPELANIYASTPNAIDVYGMPLAVKSYGPLVAVRLQRATLQLWTVDTPFAQAGSVIVGNGSDIAKEVGLWPPDATSISPPPT